MRRSDGNAPRRPNRGAARGALRLALLVSACVAGAAGEIGVVQAEPGEPAGAIVYERPAPGPRRGVLSVPASVVYGAATVTLVGAAAYLAARARRRQ